MRRTGWPVGQRGGWRRYRHGCNPGRTDWAPPGHGTARALQGRYRWEHGHRNRHTRASYGPGAGSRAPLQARASPRAPAPAQAGTGRGQRHQQGQRHGHTGTRASRGKALPGAGPGQCHPLQTHRSGTATGRTRRASTGAASGQGAYRAGWAHHLPRAPQAPTLAPQAKPLPGSDAPPQGQHCHQPGTTPPAQAPRNSTAGARIGPGQWGHREPQSRPIPAMCRANQQWPKVPGKDSQKAGREGVSNT